MSINSNHSSTNTERLPSNIMYLRDEAFYKFVQEYSGAKVTELLSFQEFNSLDSFLDCNDIAEIFRYESNDRKFNDMKEKTCICLVDGSVLLLPGLRSSINNLKKVLKKKREEINQQIKRLQSISGPTAPATHTTSGISPAAQFTAETPSLPTTTSATPLVNPPTNTQAVISTVTEQVKSKVAKVITNWLVKYKQQLRLVNTNVQEGVDFRLELNMRHDGLVLICGCGTRSSIGQKQGTLFYSNVYRHFKSNKCSWIDANGQNTTSDGGNTNNQQNPVLSVAQQSNSSLDRTTSSNGKRPTRSTSTVPKKRRNY